MHLEDEVMLLKTVDPPYKICHNIQSVHLPIHNDETFLWSIGQHCSEICMIERDLLLGLNRTDFH